MRHTKIIVTLGPSSWNENTIRSFIREGVDGFRFNFSHADYDSLKDTIIKVRELIGDKALPIIGDLQGPVVRLGEINEFPVSKGDIIYFINSSKGNIANKEVPIPDGEIFSQIREGDTLLLESGRMAFRIEDISEKRIKAVVLIDGTIKSRKTVAIKGRELLLPSLTDKDVFDIKYSVENGFDMIALSFVRSRDDILKLREILNDLGANWMRIIAKIETRSAVENIESIAKEADAILVARGDLAIYYELEEIYRVQKRIVETARKIGRPVIIATQLLESMIDNPVPTRSEVVDVITAVHSGCDALLLAAETAMGKYPVEAVIWLNKIIAEAERDIDTLQEPDAIDIYELLAKGVATMSKIIGAKIVAYSENGNTARRISKFRPHNPVYVYTSREKTAKYMSIMWGIVPRLCNISKKDPMLFEKLLNIAVDEKILNYGDIVIFTAGVRRGTTDIIRVERVKAS